MHALIRAAAAILPAAIILVLPFSVAWGGVLEIRPTMLVINPAQHVAVMSLQNPEDSAAIYQVAIYSWHQKGEQQILEKTEDMIASPPVISLPAHGTQIVRVGLRIPSLPPQEQTYRLIIEEIPAPTLLHQPGLNIALRLSLPLFVRPQTVAPPAKLDAELRLSGRKATLIVRNNGAFTARVIEAALHASILGDADGMTEKRLAYILPGGWTHYDFDMPTSMSAIPDATATLQSDDGPVDLLAPMTAEVVSDGPTPSLR